MASYYKILELKGTEMRTNNYLFVLLNTICIMPLSPAVMCSCFGSVLDIAT